MRIPEFCGVDEFVRSLTYNRQKIDDVLSKFNAGCFDEGDLNKPIAAARRIAYVCHELIKWRNVRLLVESAAEKDGLDEFGWEWPLATEYNR